MNVTWFSILMSTNIIYPISRLKEKTYMIIKIGTENVFNSIMYSKMILKYKR